MTTFLLSLLVIAALALWSWRSRGGAARGTGKPAPKACKWVAEGDAKGRLRAFRCKTCGVTAYSQRPEGPELCKRGLSDGRLN